MICHPSSVQTGAYPAPNCLAFLYCAGIAIVPLLSMILPFYPPEKRVKCFLAELYFSGITNKSMSNCCVSSQEQPHISSKKDCPLRADSLSSIRHQFPISNGTPPSESSHTSAHSPETRSSSGAARAARDSAPSARSTQECSAPATSG